ncbi:MAG: hypothetical protein LBH98_00750 [Chitinispirillales bacterium]|jgi:hypothetical protein|nr:hypothetical protein [Chitinispirillales bacterium]
MLIAVDFDGTCVTHEYPNVGKDIGAQKILKRLVDRGDDLILWTMRSGKELDDAVAWFDDNEIPLFGVNQNPTQHKWTQSQKAYANIYIDDAALGCPLVMRDISDRPFVDWEKVEQMLFDQDLIIGHTVLIEVGDKL